MVRRYSEWTPWEYWGKDATIVPQYWFIEVSPSMNCEYDWLRRDDNCLLDLTGNLDAPLP